MGTLPNLKMKLGLGDATTVSYPRDHLTTADDIALLYEQCLRMSIGGHETVRVPDQQEIPQRLDAITVIGNLAILGSPDRRAARGSDIQAVIMEPSALRTEGGDNPALDRPLEGPPRTRRRRARRCDGGTLGFSGTRRLCRRLSGR